MSGETMTPSKEAAALQQELADCIKSHQKVNAELSQVEQENERLKQEHVCLDIDLMEKDRQLKESQQENADLRSTRRHIETQLNKENERLKQELGDAAREIPMRGPVAARIRQLRIEHAQQFAALQQENERLKEQVSKYKSFGEDQDNLLNELDRQRTVLRELTEALREFIESEESREQIGEQVMSTAQARAALARAEEVLK